MFLMTSKVNHAAPELKVCLFANSKTFRFGAPQTFRPVLLPVFRECSLLTENCFHTRGGEKGHWSGPKWTVGFEIIYKKANFQFGETKYVYVIYS